MASWRPKAFLVVMIVLSGSAVAQARDYVPWAPDLSTAQQTAASRNQLVLLHFSSDDCPPCRRLEKKVFNKRTFGHAVGELFVPVNINVSENPELAQRFGVTSWPTDIVTTPAGQEIHRMVSPQDMARYVTTLRQVAWRHRTTPAGAMAASYPLKAPPSTAPMHAPPFAPQTPGLTDSALPPRTSLASKDAFRRGEVFQQGPTATPPAGYSAPMSPQVSIDQTAQQYANQQSTPTQSPRAENTLASPNSVVVQNQYAAPNPPGTTSTAYAAPTAYAAAPESQRSMYGGTHLAAVPAAPQQQAATTQQPPTQAASATQPQHVVSPTPTAAPAVANTPLSAPGHQVQPAVNAGASTSQSVALATAEAATQADVTEPKMGLDGHCPVTLAEEDRWVRGNVQWGARHRGCVYLFQSQAAQQRFLANPDQFSPILSGHDPLVFVETGKLEPGYRAHGLRFQNSIVLFSSEASLTRFAQNPAAVMTQLNQAMMAANSQNVAR